jgi:hypothetical protein
MNMRYTHRNLRYKPIKTLPGTPRCHCAYLGRLDRQHEDARLLPEVLYLVIWNYHGNTSLSKSPDLERQDFPQIGRNATSDSFCDMYDLKRLLGPNSHA